MRTPHRLRAALAAALLVVLSCGDDPPGPGAPAECIDGGPPSYLASKIDDDDGDGNILDEDFPRINDEDDDISDHAWVRDPSGLYHLFFHTEGLYAGSTIEHYTTRDFQHLDYVGTALAPTGGGWDGDQLWAPHIIAAGDRWYMFYTGVAGAGATAIQRIGLAESADLTTWTRVPVNNCPGTTGYGCIYDCDEGWTTWGDSNDSFNQQCRDPFVIWDADNGRWVLFLTAKSTNQFGVVTVATSSDLTAWSGEGFIDATRRLAAGTGAQTTGGQAENPFVMTHEGTNFLLFTDWQDQEDTLTVVNPRTMVQYATSPDLEADTLGSAGWTYRGYTPDPGVNAIEVVRINSSLWLMTQSVSNVNSGYHAGHRRELLLKCLTFGPGPVFDTTNLVFPTSSNRSLYPVAPSLEE